MAGKWTKVGSVLRKKEGDGVYLKVSDNVSLFKDQILNFQDPRKRPGITPEQLEKIPDFVRFEVFIPPKRD